MKSKIFSIFSLVFIFLTANVTAQQWAGPNDFFGDIVRIGAVKIGNGTSNPAKMLTLHADNNPVLRFERQGNKWDFEIYGDSGGNLKFRGGSDNVGSALKDHMTIKGNGKVVIGSNNTPNSIAAGMFNLTNFKLYVQGGILTEEVIVRTNWADYVFLEDYKLTPLAEVEQHIEEKGHLHNTPSAQEIKDKGMAVGEITTNQQEKIEELFLHVISLEKRIIELEKENMSLTSGQSFKGE